LLLEQFKKLLAPDESSSGTTADAVALASAALLIEVARADFTADDAELNAMIDHLTQVFSLSPDDVDRLTAQAASQVDHATSLYEFTRTVNDNCTPKARIQLIDAMWQVAYADGILHKYEEHLIRRTSELLYVAHADFIQAKHRAKALIP